MRAQRSVPWPELLLVAGFVVLFSLFVVGSSAAACHEWRHKLTTVTSALMTTNSLADPLPESAGEREELRRRAREVLEDRPFACL